MSSILQQIQSIFSSVQSGNSLTSAQYEILAESSENETIRAVGSQNAPLIESAYNSYVQNVVIPEVDSLVLCSDGEGNEWYERK